MRKKPSGTNPFPGLLEYWYQRYVQAHPSEFGFTSLEGPFDVGPDFIGLRDDGLWVTVEVERDYLGYIQHGHPLFDEPVPKFPKLVIR